MSVMEAGVIDVPREAGGGSEGLVGLKTGGSDDDNDEVEIPVPDILSVGSDTTTDTTGTQSV